MIGTVKTKQPPSPGDEPGRGERLERGRRLTLVALAAAIALAGGAVGFLIGHRHADAFLDETARWPAEVAILAALTWVAIACIGRVLIRGRLDEFELQTQQKIWAAGAEAYFFAYPLWFLLWKGDLVPEPMHQAIFLGFVAAMAAAAFFHRFR